MTDITLPKLNQTGSNEFVDVEDNDVAIREVVNGELDNGNLSGAAGITRANLAAESKPLCWYAPTIVPATQTRSNSSYGTLATPDEVKEVVVPERGLLLVSYAALIRESAGNGEMHAAIFLNSTQLRTATNTADEVSTGQSTPWIAMVTNGATASEAGGLGTVGDNGSEEIPSICIIGTTEVFAPAGTYNVAVKYKSTGGGTAAAKERRLYVGVKGAVA